MPLLFHGLNAGFSRGPAFCPVSTWRVFTTSSLLLMEKHNLTCQRPGARLSKEATEDLASP